MSKTDTAGRYIIHQGNFENKCAELKLLKEQIKALDIQAKPLGEAIKEFAKVIGSQTDTGGFVSELERFTVEARAKNSVVFDEDKVRMLLLQRPELTNDLYKLTQVIDTEGIDRLYNNGQLSDDEMASMVKVTTSHSLYITEREEMPAIAESAAQVKRKPVLQKRK